MKTKSVIMLIIILLVLTLINISIMSSGNKLLVFISAVFILTMVFLCLVLFHKYYQNATNKLHPFSILLIIYLIIITDIALQTQVYSIEWAFLAFIICATILYDFKIDSRFMILPALLLLAYLPFLLIGKYSQIAETAAIYIYYFLVVGVAIQFAEYINKKPLSLDFEKTMQVIIKKAPWLLLINITGIITIGIIIINRINNNIKSLDLIFWQYTLIYFFVIFVIFYSISRLSTTKEQTI